MSLLSHLLFETAGGYAIFKVQAQTDELATATQAYENSFDNLHLFGKLVQLLSFTPFADAAQALANQNDISEGVVSPELKAILDQALSSGGKKSGVVLGVSDRNLASSIKAELNIECEVNEKTQNYLRAVRLHASKLLKGLQESDLVKAQLGLTHAYSRSKVKWNVNRSDNMIIQAIALLDQLDKDVNTFAMRVREWYGWHFPELIKVVPDNYQYALIAKAIGDKSTLSEDDLPKLAAILTDDDVRAKTVLDAARSSIGTDISPIDLINISNFANRVASIAEYRRSIQLYLHDKMNIVAPNLAALIGDAVGARLISHAGSLTNLAKYPASTVQILGAEKALFRALKTKGNTPKYGLIYHSSFITRAGGKFKGRISRFLANKASIASRIDCFSETPTDKYGHALREQVEERLTFFETGVPPSKNKDIMQKVSDAIAAEDADDEAKIATDLVPVSAKSLKKAKKNKETQDTEQSAKSDKKEKKDKKDKKDKKRKAEDDPSEEPSTKSKSKSKSKSKN